MAAPVPRDLATATAQGDTNAVDQLISRGCDVNQRSKDGMTPLSIAAFWGYADITEKLLENGANINIQNVGTSWSPLHCAAFQGHGPVIHKLMNHNPDLSIKDSRHRTASDFASALDSIWPLFAVKGCRRTPKSELIRLDIVEKVQYEAEPSEPADLAHFSRPGSSYAVRAQLPMEPRDPQMEVAAITGDVLAATPDDTDFIYQQRRPGLLVWDN